MTFLAADSSSICPNVVDVCSCLLCYQVRKLGKKVGKLGKKVGKLGEKSGKLVKKKWENLVKKYLLTAC